jgi:hypothetical protein
VAGTDRIAVLVGLLRLHERAAAPEVHIQNLTPLLVVSRTNVSSSYAETAD